MSIQQALAAMWILAVGGNLAWIWRQVTKVERLCEQLEKRIGEKK